MLNLNNPHDHKIYYYIKDTRNQIKYPIVLTTHHGLFTYMQNENNVYQDYDICFFDTEQRYKSYNFFLSSPCDLYYTLNSIESFLYQEEVENQIKKITKQNEENTLEQFVNTFQIFIGVVFNESKKLFIKNEATMVSHDPIREHSDFYQTNLLRKQLLNKKDLLKHVLSQENYITLETHIKHIQKVFDTVLNIFKKTYGNGDYYFTYGEAQKFTDWKEFIEIFKNKVIFFSNTNKQLTRLSTTEINTTTTTKNIISIPRIEDIITHLKQKQQNESTYSCFIFSPKKEESKKIFEDICKNNIHNQTEILVENITGGIGKNIFKAKQNKNKIII